ncbi:MAG: 4Fe-4S dicluster domain-containing protein [bacterium]|nr:4Fe-4S dicluster domain-containing protein [bacterium]
MAETNRFHSIKIDKERCSGCVNCMKACPTKAIRVRDEKAVLIDRKCVDCGECLRVCPHGAIVPITTPTSDLEKFKYKVALPSPVLYSQFGQHIMPNEILSVLKEMGFDYAYDETVMCEMTSMVIDEYLDEHTSVTSGGPLISSTCPVVVRLIQRMFPSLCERIIPIEPPREIAARSLRDEISRRDNIPKEDIGIFHITPCPAKMVSINYPESMAKSYLNGAVSIRELYNKMMMKLKRPEPLSMLQTQSRISGIGLGWAAPGGEVRGVKYHSVSVAGVFDTIKILRDVEAGKLKDIKYLECLICPDGCLGGPLTVENRFVAKSNILMLIRMYSGKKSVEAFAVKKLYKEGFFSFESKVKAKPFPALDEDRENALRKLGLKDELIRDLPGMDCGVCGAPDCKTLADDIVREEAVLSDCRFKTKVFAPLFSKSGPPEAK